MPRGRIARRDDRGRVIEQIRLDVLQQAVATATRFPVTTHETLEIGQQPPVEQRAPEDVAEPPHHVRRRDVGQPERDEHDGPDARAADHDPEPLERLEEMERDDTVVRGVAHGADGCAVGRGAIHVHHPERAAPQGVAHALRALPDELHAFGRGGVQIGIEERVRLELKLGPQGCHEIAQHRGADHARQDLERPLPPVGLAPPPPVQHGQPRLVTGRERHAVQQLSPLDAERLPQLFDFEEHTEAQRCGLVAREREEVRRHVPSPPRPGYPRRPRRPVGEHRQTLEIEDVGRHLLRLRSTPTRGDRSHDAFRRS